MRRIRNKSKGGDDGRASLRAAGTNCNEGLQNAALPKPDQIWLLSQIRHAAINDQRAVLSWLQTKFGGHA